MLCVSSVKRVLSVVILKHKSLYCFANQFLLLGNCLKNTYFKNGGELFFIKTTEIIILRDKGNFEAPLGLVSKI